jgi:hypothetical protein
VPEHPRPVRILQLIGDTDVVPSQVAALSLHRELVALGLEVRTLALAPGRRGGLEQDVPAIAPGRRSFAARGQVFHESRWADVVVVHAPRALTPATVPSRRSGGPPVVLAFWAAPPSGVAAGWSAESRLVRIAARVVVASESVAAAVRARYGRDHGVVVVPADLGDEGRPVLDGTTWADLLEQVTA